MGCAWPNSTPVYNDLVSAQSDEVVTHVGQVSGLTNWSFNGKLGVKKDGEGFSARVSWNQNHEDYIVDVRTFMLGEIFSIKKSNSIFVINEGEGASYEVESSEDFFHVRLGWSFPESSISFWLRGIPNPVGDFFEDGPETNGRYRRFSQSGWQVEIIEYDESIKPALPKRLTIGNNDLELLIVVDKWSVY